MPSSSNGNNTEGHLAVDYAVLLPNHRVLEYSAVSTEADQIYGRDQMPDLIARIRNGMGQTAANPAQARNVRRFIMGSIGLEEDIDSLTMRVLHHFNQSDTDLTGMVQRMECSPWHICIEGRGGCGKTLLGRHISVDAAKKGERAISCALTGHWLMNWPFSWPAPVCIP